MQLSNYIISVENMIQCCKYLFWYLRTQTVDIIFDLNVLASYLAFGVFDCPCHSINVVAQSVGAVHITT